MRVLAALVAVSALTWAFVLLRSGFSGTVPPRAHAEGEVITVELAPGDAAAVYVGFDDAAGIGFETSYPFRPVVDSGCAIVAGPPGAVLVLPERNLTVTADGIEWHQVHLLRVTERGSYQLRCTAGGGYAGVGQDLPPGLLTQVGGLFAGAFAAGAAGVTTIVISRKRRAARRRRAASW